MYCRKRGACFFFYHYPDIRYGMKFSKNNIGHEDRIYTFPYFCVFLLKRFMADFHAIEEYQRDKR